MTLLSVVKDFSLWRELTCVKHCELEKKSDNSVTVFKSKCKYHMNRTHVGMLYIILSFPLNEGLWKLVHVSLQSVITIICIIWASLYLH